MTNSIQTQNLDTLIDTVRQHPERGATQFTAETRWAGGLASEARIRNFAVRMDEPETLGGGDTAPNMVEMVLAAYGACLTVGYVMNAHRMDIPLEDVRVELEGDLDLRGFLSLAEPNRVWPGYSRVRVTVRLFAPSASEPELQLLHREVLRTSPVGSIIERAVPVDAQLVLASRTL